MIDYLVRF